LADVWEERLAVFRRHRAQKTERSRTVDRRDTDSVPASSTWFL